MEIKMGELLIIFIWLMLKHTIADYLLQRPWKDKGIYGSRGGLIHAAHHVGGAFIVLMFYVSFPLAVLLSVLDGILHYHIDFAKNNIKKPSIMLTSILSRCHLRLPKSYALLYG